MLIRMTGGGDAPSVGKGVRGDLLVRVTVQPSKEFSRQGSHLYYTARIPLQTALLGGRIRVPTLDGQVDVRVPSGTQQAEKMVLKGRGVTSTLGGGQGDLYVEFLVQIPRYVVGIHVSIQLTGPTERSRIVNGLSSKNTLMMLRVAPFPGRELEPPRTPWKRQVKSRVLKA
jgi:DnaJ-class molecular chaperone